MYKLLYAKYTSQFNKRSYNWDLINSDVPELEESEDTSSIDKT